MSFRVKGLQDAHSPTHVRCPGAWEQRGRGVSGGMGVGPGPVLHHGRWKGSHKVLYYRPTKMRELHVLLSLVWVSFFLVFSQNSSRNEKCRRQVSQAPGFRSEGSREAGRSCYFRLALGSVPASREQSLKPQFFSSPVPRWPPWRAAGQEHLGLLCLEAWSPKHRPTGARQRKEAEGASTEGW